MIACSTEYDHHHYQRACTPDVVHGCATELAVHIHTQPTLHGQSLSQINPHSARRNPHQSSRHLRPALSIATVDIIRAAAFGISLRWLGDQAGNASGCRACTFGLPPALGRVHYVVLVPGLLAHQRPSMRQKGSPARLQSWVVEHSFMHSHTHKPASACQRQAPAPLAAAYQSQMQELWSGPCQVAPCGSPHAGSAGCLQLEC